MEAARLEWPFCFGKTSDGAREDLELPLGARRTMHPAMSSHVIPRYEYRRKLPHIQNGQKCIFVTMGTHLRWELPAAARAIVLERIRAVHGRRMFLYAAVVMPDHAHLLFHALADAAGRLYSLPEIMHAIRGPSAHAVNKALARTGAVWQEEFFDRLLRHGEFEKTMEYICLNPVRRGLVRSEFEYPWLWVEPVY